MTDSTSTSTSTENQLQKEKEQTNSRRMLHLVMQGKGGAGKSLVSSLLCQFYQLKERQFDAIDLDPVNHTLSAIGPLDAQVWNILKSKENPTIDPVQFDALVDHVLRLDGDVVIDTGSTSFLSFNNYLIQQGITDLLSEYQVDTKIHCVIRGGSSLSDCMGGLDQLCKHHSPETTDIYVWLNEVEGEIKANSKTFEEMKVYARWNDRIDGVIRIPEQTNELYTKDMTDMLQNHQTFAEAIESSDTGLVSKKRLDQLRSYYADAISLHF